MKKIIYITILIMIFSNNIFAENFTEVFKKADSLYQANKYDEAIKKYENIVASNYESVNLFYNLGNSYYRTGKFTHAIYYYEKAKKLSPNDADINYNLKLVKDEIVDKIQEKPDFFLISFFKSITNSETSTFWGILSLSTFIMFLTTLLAYFFSKKRKIKVITFYSAIFIFVISLTTFTFAQKQYQNVNSENTAIIFSPSVSVKSSPADDATELFIIHEGLKVKLQDESAEWREIQLPDGKEGWLKKNDYRIL